MTKKFMILLLVMGLMFGVVVGVASAQVDQPPRPPQEPVCELDEWELLVLKLLAKRFDVTQEEIEGWYCEGYSFGEIVFAYQISLKSETPVEEIFAMLDEDLSWVEILIAVGLIDDLLPGDMLDPPVVGEFPGKFPLGDLVCMDNGSDPKIQMLAEMYGLTYEEAYQWVCGPFTYTNFGSWGGNVDNWEKMEFKGSRIGVPGFDIDLGNLFDGFGDHQDDLDQFEDFMPEMPDIPFWP